MIDAALVKQRTAILELLGRCESPVEQMLMAALWARWRCQVSDNRMGMSAVLDESPIASPARRVVVEPQKVIPTERARYRADALVYVLDGAENRLAPGPLVVEVDGHDFHERTRFQAARDRQRDRAMIAEGFRVVRFTGSEIYRDPERCAAEIGKLVAQPTGSIQEHG